MFHLSCPYLKKDKSCLQCMQASRPPVLVHETHDADELPYIYKLLYILHSDERIFLASIITLSNRSLLIPKEEEEAVGLSEVLVQGSEVSQRMPSA